MINYNEINDFIIKVFNYYNGKINIINPAVLNINWCDLIGSNMGGSFSSPNIVTIYPKVIFRYCDNDEYFSKIQIIETLIHELHHTDQLINYQLYNTDINYYKYIEHSCQIETANYIYGHKQEIYNIFGIELLLNRDAYDEIINYWYYPGLRYHRRYIHDHIFMCIDYLCGMSIDGANNLYELICLTIEDEKNITITINNDTIPACINGILININEFNKVLIKYKCNGEYEPILKIDIDDDLNLFIFITMQPMNNMCVIV